MISNLTIKHLRPDTRTMLVVGGSTGEEELAISASMGPGGFSTFIVVAMSTGGWGTVRCHRAVLNPNLAGEIVRELKAWAHDGARPSNSELVALHEEVMGIMRECLRIWGLDAPGMEC